MNCISKSRVWAGMTCKQWSIAFKFRSVWSHFVASDEGLREAGMVGYRFHIQTHYEVPYV